MPRNDYLAQLATRPLLSKDMPLLPLQDTELPLGR